MKKVNLAFAQTRKEIIFINRNIKNKGSITWVPVNLETLIFFEENKINYLNPLTFLKNNFHKEGIIGSEKMIKKFKFRNNLDQFLVNRYIGIQRKYFNSCFFINEVLKKIKKKYLINKIFLSGWQSFSFVNPENNYFLSKILKNSFLRNKVILLNRDKINNSRKIYDFKIITSEFKDNYIIVSNLGYNFKRIFFNLFNKKIKIATFNQERLPWYKKTIYKILGLKIIKIKKINSKKKTNINIPKIHFTFKKINYSNIINSRKNEALYELQELKNLSLVVKSFLQNNKPKLIMLNVLRGINGYLSESSEKLNIPCLQISHGTLSLTGNKYSNKYNKILSEELTTKKGNIFCVQSKIADKFVKKFRKNSQNIKTGNLIFNQTIKNNGSDILYAVTNRGFDGMHFYGIEMFYEYFQNLIFLNKIAKSIKNKKIIVKPHPTEFKSIPYLKKIFKNLYFTDQKNHILFKKIGVTISYSSTIIEDSLNSKIPVILFDQWKRYKHCDSETNTSKKNSAVYYVNSKNNLGKCIKTIVKSTKFNFQKYIYERENSKSFKKLFNNLSI